MTTSSETTPTPDAAGSQATTRTAQARAVAAIHGGETWEEATKGVLAALAGLAPPGAVPPDVALVFVDSRFADAYEAIVQRVRAATGAAHLLGCSGQSVIGPAREEEEQAAVSVLALTLPGVIFTPVALAPEEPGDAAWAQIAGTPAHAWLTFADPFSVDAEQLLRRVEARCPGVPLLGGLASAHTRDTGTALFLEDRVYRRGAVLLGVSGAVQVHTLVAQGATPIGRPWIITDCERNVVRTIGSRPALEVLIETLEALADPVRRRVQHNLFVGLAMDEYREQHGRGDYLIRNLLGIDRDRGAIAINALPRVGQTLQFQFRDAAAADEDLRAHLADFKQTLAPDQVVLGTVLCACNGRGRGLFGVPHHDAATVADLLGPIPTAGLFCNGEIGPVGGANFVHGFTASIALLTAPTG